MVGGMGRPQLCLGAVKPVYPAEGVPFGFLPPNLPALRHSWAV